MIFLRCLTAIAALGLLIPVSSHAALEGGITHGGGGDGMTGEEIIMEALHDEGFTITNHGDGIEGAVSDVFCLKPHGAVAYTDCRATDMASGRVIQLQYPHPFSTGVMAALERRLKIVRDANSEHFSVRQVVCKERYPYDMDTTCRTIL